MRRNPYLSNFTLLSPTIMKASYLGSVVQQSFGGSNNELTCRLRNALLDVLFTSHGEQESQPLALGRCGPIRQVEWTCVLPQACKYGASSR